MTKSINSLSRWDIKERHDLSGISDEKKQLQNGASLIYL
jgi:hypothetical protein